MSLATTDSNLPAVLGRKELDTLRRTIAHDLNDSEFELFAAICRRTGLDPIARQIYAVKRWDGRQKREVMQVQTSIDGFRVIAQRSGIYAGPATTYWCGPDGKWVDVWLAGEPPAAAKAGVYRKDFAEPVYAVAKFESYCARNKDGSLQNLWRTMPEVMIAKCAEALAIRKAFPNDVAGVYTREEMAQANNVRVTVQRPSAPPLPAEVSGGGEPTSPPAAAPGVRTGGSRNPGGDPESHGGRAGSIPAYDSAPSGVSPEPGGDAPAPPTTSTPLDVQAVEQTSVPHTDAPAGPDTEAPEWFAGANRKARAIAKSALGDDSKDAEYVARWEALVWAASGGTTTESKALTRDQHQAFTQRLKDVSSGLAAVVESDDPQWLGFTLAYREAS